MSFSGNTLERGREGAGIRPAPQGLSLQGQRETSVGERKNRVVPRKPGGREQSAEEATKTCGISCDSPAMPRVGPRQPPQHGEWTQL